MRTKLAVLACIALLMAGAGAWAFLGHRHHHGTAVGPVSTNTPGYSPLSAYPDICKIAEPLYPAWARSLPRDRQDGARNTGSLPDETCSRISSNSSDATALDIVFQLYPTTDAACRSVSLNSSGEYFGHPIGNDGAFEATCFQNAEMDIHMYRVSSPYSKLREQALAIFRAIEARL